MNVNQRTIDIQCSKNDTACHHASESTLMIVSSNQPSKHIILLTHEFYPKRGGIAVYCEETAQAAHELGYNVTVWAPQDERLPQERFSFPVETIANRGSLNWPCRIQTARHILKHKTSLKNAILYLPEPGPIITCMYLQLFQTIEVAQLVLTLHGSEILRFTHTPHRRYLFQKLMGSAQTIGVASRHVEQLLLEKCPHAQGKTKVVSGALRSDFPPISRQPKTEETVKIITVGRIHPRKGQHHVIRALGSLSDSLKQRIEYKIVGPIVKRPYFEQLRQEAERSGVNVLFLHEVSDADLPNHYTAADIFAMTSEVHGPSIEGFGLVYLEAAHCGLPVIAHDTGGVNEAVRHNQTGFVIQPEDHAALRDAFEKLIENKSLREQFATAGQQRVKELSWKSNVSTLFSSSTQKTQ